MKKENKKRVKTVKKEKTEKKCESFGNRCTICGTFFEDGFCQHGHEMGETYWI
ncbi:MAG: hypothetical protein PHH52_00880 [Patescibacteria group bacterium]|jgi:hypothetical protein|nr:hypothetical protein [Patescibacteria group bacterium]MDD3939511.1 hypothetical protein [Patescibacteria group bacterium]MDD4443736.1 hypothetical protein [Patescibacteria group bacterium]